MTPRLTWVLLALAPLARAENAPVVPRFALPRSGLELRAAADRGRFLDVVGRRSALFAYEGHPAEVWVYPLKLVDDFALAFRLKDYPVEIQGQDVLARIEVRP